MAIGNRIVVKPVGSGIVFNSSSKDDMVLVYKLILDQAGNMVIDSSGGALVERAGGVKSGSTGVISGPSIRVPKKALIEYANESASLGVDLVNLFPIKFDNYSGVGWLPADAIRHV
jgi:hypothetical protein